MKRKLLIFIGILAFIFPFLFSKNTFADEKDIYISRVYATDGKEFIEFFNKDKDRNFKDLSLRNTHKQTEIANIQNGILKANNYIKISQQSEDSDIKFKEEFRNIDTIGRQLILGLCIDGELKSYICSDEKRCVKGYFKNSTDLKPTNKNIEKKAVTKEEIPETSKEDRYKNNNKTPVENRDYLGGEKKQEDLNTSEDRKDSKIPLILRENLLLAPNTG